MENTLKKKKTFFQKMAELFFSIYLITLYIFVDRSETVIISQIAFIIFVGLTVLVVLQKKRIHFGRNVMIVYIAFAWMFATYFWAQNQYIAWIKIKTMWQLFLLFFLVHNLFCEEENAHQYLLKCLYVAGISLLGYSIYTYGLSKVIDMMTGNGNLRLGRDINQENTFGMLNATTCMVSFYYLFYRKRFKLFHIPVFALAFLFSMSSGSRTSLLTILIGVLYLVYNKYGIRQVYKVVVIVLVLSILFINVMQLPVFETINHRMEQLGRNLSGQSGGDTSSATRMDMIADGWDIFKERPLTGYGADNYRVVSRFRTYSHNNFIEILVDFGIIGFVIYYAVYFNVFENLHKMKFNEGKALLTVFIVRCVMEMFTITYYGKLHWVMFAFFLIKPVDSINNAEGEIENEIIFEKNHKSSN